MNLAALLLAASTFAKPVVMGASIMELDVRHPPSSYPLDILDLITRFSITFNEDGDLLVDPAFHNEGLLRLARDKGIKVLVSLGRRNSPWTKVAGDAALLKGLTDRLSAFLRDKGYDGLDVDWEPMPRNEEEGRAQAAFLAALRKALPPGSLLTVDTSAPAWIRWPDLIETVDRINLMAYDYHGWENHAGHNAPLFPTQSYRDPCGRVSVSGTVDEYLGRHGLPPEKILLGLPFYGHSFSGPGLYEATTGESRLWTFADVCRLLARPDVVLARDKAAGVPTAHSANGTQHVSYDDAESLGLKLDFARNKGLGGVYIWALGFDDLESGKKPLVDAVRAGMKRW